MGTGSRETYSYGEILRVSLPLAITMGTTMVMEFTDRIFLARYSVAAIAAAMPAGVVAFWLISFFMGVAGYVHVFIAQYTGAGDHRRVGGILWQGIWFSAGAGLVLAALSLAAGPLFRLTGHPPEIQALERIYFQVLCQGAGIHILGVTLAGFHAGRGRTRIVMFAHLVGTAVNIPLDYALINGLGPLPELGIVGAGIATVTAWAVITGCFVVTVFTDANDRRYGVRRRFAPSVDGFLRLLRFGVPAGAQFTTEIFAFAFFINAVGRLGETALAVSNIVFSINSLAFMPMVGLSMGASILVGQSLGRNLPDQAAGAVTRTIHIALGYTLAMAVVFLAFPEPIFSLFRPRDLNPTDFGLMVGTGEVILRFVVLYMLFDAGYMVYMGALKGAGDTRFIMVCVATVSILVLVVPLVAGMALFNAGLIYAWSCLTVFIASLFVVTYGRYRRGGWREIRVIEG